eukprot:4683334-Alexandrium_andersonii.AAC.1
MQIARAAWVACSAHETLDARVARAASIALATRHSMQVAMVACTLCMRQMPAAVSAECVEAMERKEGSACAYALADFSNR